MAIVYQQQSWASGNSVFTSMNVYDRDTNGPDTLYPEIKNAEAVTITGGRLDWSGTYSDYQGAGVTFQGFPSFMAQTGSITARYRPNATSLGSLGFAPLIWGIALGNTSFETSYDADLARLEFFVVTWGAGVPDIVATVPYTFASNTDYVLRCCWRAGTPEGNFTNVLADGYFRFYVNNTLVYEVLNIGLFFNYQQQNRLDEVWFGFFGLLGALDQIVFDDAACGAAVAGTCCGSSGPGGAAPSTGFSGTGETNRPRIIPPGGALPGYTACAAGGVPATAADPSEGQILW